MFYAIRDRSTNFSLTLHVQQRKFFHVGQLMAMSLVQQGSGFPFIAPPVYQYLCGTEMHMIELTTEDVPNYEVRLLLHEV